ncbi:MULTISPECIES: DedA family protein [Clostridium]|uniref:DedA family protein n=1 Tax=Clostridium TaxID=1485 RepID=UPI000822B83A|nr:DedA family protein [Clostridium saudiense]MDU7455635.1 DedA family protein [Clostridium saudiense]SCK00415.1 SNARE associated Golgi protein [uncultured Clostridium sp.]
MDIKEMISVLSSHNIYIIFIIMFLESLNLTGIPSTIILPAIGILISLNNLSIIKILLLTIFASILGNIVFYFISYKFGSKIYDYLYNKFPKLQKVFDKAMNMSNKYGTKICLFGRLIPSIRSWISLVAGIFKVKLRDFLLYSSIGIFIWDILLILVGYLIPIKY